MILEWNCPKYRYLWIGDAFSYKVTQQCSGSGCIRVFSAHPDPCFLIRFWRNLTKRVWLTVLNMKNNFFKYFYLHFLGVFFIDLDPRFSGSDPDFWPLRIRTQWNKSDTDQEKRTRIRNTVTKFQQMSQKAYVEVLSALTSTIHEERLCRYEICKTGNFKCQKSWWGGGGGRDVELFHIDPAPA